MLIDILVKSRKSGILAKEMPGSLSFFSNNTLSIRRSILSDIGKYDEDCHRSEDVEICARIARSKWMMFLSKDMIFHHRPRTTIKALMKQWWGYGEYIPYVFKKHNAGQWEIFYRRGDASKLPFAPGLRYRKLLYLEKMPTTVCVFITPFLLSHLFLLSSVVAFSLSCISAGIIFGIMAALWFFIYAQPDFQDNTSVISGMQLLYIRYLVNLSFFLSQLINGLRIGALYIAPVISERSAKN
jgi:hypothetical protein